MIRSVTSHDNSMPRHPVLTRRAPAFACALVLTTAACGGGSVAEIIDAGTGHDAARSPDATTPSDASTGRSFVSNTPSATVSYVGAAPSLVLVSSNLRQDPSAVGVFQQWLGEIKNTGTTTACLVEIVASFESSAGAPLALFDTFADAESYMGSGSPLSTPCIAPGEIGSVYDNAFVTAEVSIADIGKIAVQITHLEPRDLVLAPHAPLVTSHVAPVFSGFGVTGTFTGRGGTIHNISLDAYVHDATGLVTDWLFAADLDPLAPGQVVAFTTVSTPTSFSEYRQYTDFTDGAQSVRAFADRSPAAAPDPAIAGPAAARRQHREAVAARAARAAPPALR